MKCNICENNCFIREGEDGKCGQYKNTGGRIREKRPNRYIIITPITIETMPMLHFQPRGKFLQISTVGCNLDCPGCISTVIVKEIEAACIELQHQEPQEVVQQAMDQECLGIAFLMNDPLASWPTFVSVAKEAKKNGLLVGCSTNSYFTQDSLQEILPWLDFINVGVKGFSDQIYRECGARSAQPVWRNIEILYRAGVHVEISCVYRKNEAHSIMEFARQTAALSPDIPVQIMRFIPMEGADPALETSIREAEDLCDRLQEVLNYVYLFNSPGTSYLDTLCPHCGEWLFKRDFYGPMGARLKTSQVNVTDEGCFCARCEGAVPVHHNATAGKVENYQEAEFQGGYPFTRALEILESIVIAMGIDDKEKIARVWNHYTRQTMLDRLHHEAQKPEGFIEIVRQIGEMLGAAEAADELADYLASVVSMVREGQSRLTHKPRVYYAMGYPLFAIKGGRMENQLVEIAGGVSVNQEVEISGRPGANITAEQLNALNPDIIFISAFIASTVEDFYAQCLRQGVTATAVKQHQIYAHPAPGWDFGSPRWVLGLMNIASVLHSDVYPFELAAEAESFYEKFYHIPFQVENINRSFAKPSCRWNL